MVTVYVEKKNQFGRKTIFSKKKPSNSLKQYSGKYFTRYSVGSDDHYVAKKGVELKRDKK